MSGTQIPNLNTLRRGGGRGGRGGFARPRPVPQHSPENDFNDPSLPVRFASNEFRVPQRRLSSGPDAAIAGTDLEAARSRLEIQKLGYLQDDFVKFFTPETPQSPSSLVPTLPRIEKNRGAVPCSSHRTLPNGVAQVLSCVHG